jgi:hypothetical protein
MGETAQLQAKSWTPKPSFGVTAECVKRSTTYCESGIAVTLLYGDPSISLVDQTR